MRTALIETATGKVVNCIELEPESGNWQPPAGHHIRDAKNGGPGDTWDGTQFIKPPSPTSTSSEQRKTRLKELLALGETNWTLDQRREYLVTLGREIIG